jgi:glycosyltransferase 2 family protein
MRSHAWKIAVSLVLAGLLLFLFLKGIDPRKTKEVVLQASPAWLASGLGLGIVTFLFRALRWTWILKPVARVRFVPAFRATAAGFAANNLPGKVGEILRPALLARSEKLPFSPLLASVALERVFDGASVIFYLLIALWRKPAPGVSVGMLGLIPAAVLLALVSLAAFAVFRRAQTERFMERIWRRLPVRMQPRIEAFCATFVDGLASLKSPGLLAAIVAGSLGMWLVINLQIYSVLRAFHLDLPLSAAFVVTSAAVLGLAVPTPGGLGSYQAAVAETLKRAFGVAPEPAAGVAILAWLTSFVLITLIGLTMLVLFPGAPSLAEAERKKAEADRIRANSSGGQ